MDITLTRDELTDVVEALDHRLRALHEELIHTDDRSFREGLRKDVDRVERLKERLGERSERLDE